MKSKTDNLLVDPIFQLNPRSELEIQAMLQRQKADIIGEEALKKIEIVESGEPIVPILEYAPSCIIKIKPRRLRYIGETLYARQSVAIALEQICSEITPLRPMIFDAFRPIEYQEKRYRQRYEEIKEENPNWTNQQICEETFIYVFPPSRNPKTPPPHSTGAALDLTFATANGEALNMGFGYEFGSLLMYTNAKGLPKKARENRDLLIRTMASKGFVSFPGEWWHFSLGDREWAAYLGINTPVPYGRVEDPYNKTIT